MARQKMILDSQRATLLKNGAANLAHRLDDGNTEDFRPVVKLFNPCGAATWLLSELDEDGDTAFGLCDLGMGSPELGYISLAEVAEVQLPHGLYIERDIHFTAKKTLSEYATEARAAGRIEAY
jgi:hypothetical protein